MKILFPIFLSTCVLAIPALHAGSDKAIEANSPFVVASDLETGNAEAEEFASLVWDTEQIEITAQPGDTHAEAVFTFTNTSWKPVTILRVQPSCGCTTAKLEKTTYAPGEKGTIVADFEFGQREGIQRKKISVTTDPRAENPIVLEFVTHIPKAMAVDPRLLTWGVGHEAETKEVTVSLLPIEGTRLLSVEDSDSFTTEIVDEGNYTYTLRVTPKSTENRRREAIDVFAQIGNTPEAEGVMPKQQKVVLYLSISPWVRTEEHAKE